MMNSQALAVVDSARAVFGIYYVHNPNCNLILSENDVPYPNLTSDEVHIAMHCYFRQYESEQRRQ